MKTRLLLFSATLCIALSGCKKQVAEIFSHAVTKAPVSDQKGSVYVCGYESNGKHYVAKYWRDGIPFTLTDGTKDASAQSIFVYENNIYVAGYESTNDGHVVAKYWKNGIAVTLSDETKDNYATGIAVMNGDVYVSGYEEGTTTIAKYWKNGNEVLLNTGNLNAMACSVFIYGTDIYFSGSASSGSTPYMYAAYWKNNTITFLPAPENSYSYSVFVKDGNVFTAGYLDPGIAVYWKSNIKTELSCFVPAMQHSEARSVFVTGKDVYVAGMEYTNGQYKPMYWKNSVPVVLDISGAYSTATSIVVNTAAVFVSGVLASDDSFNRACYWANGNPVFLTDGTRDAGALQIFITP